MRTARVLCSAALLVFISADRVKADIIFTVELTKDQEVPFPMGNTPAFGTATFVLNDARTALTFIATFEGIDITGTQTPNTTFDNLSAGHIHASAAPDAPTRPVVWGFFGMPFNETNPNDQIVMPFTDGRVGGVISGKWDLMEGNNTTLAAQIPNLLEGRAYFNLHTVGNPPGEIRGNFPVTPEPSTLALFAATGALVLARYRLRRKPSPSQTPA